MKSALRQYQQELTVCRKQFESLDLQREQGYLIRFTTFSANMQNLLPEIPRTQHERLFRELLLQQIFTSFDQECLSAGDLVKLKGGADSLMTPDQPRIYCTYHLGSYRQLTSILYRRGVDCVLLVGSNMNRHQGGDLQGHIDALRQQRGLTNAFRIVDTGNPTSVMTILRELKAGRSLVVYVDGSPETAPQPGEEDKFLSVQFGNRRVMTRKGVAYLSHVSGVPIVPVVSYRQDNLVNVLECLESIVPDKRTDRETYCQKTLQRLYSMFWTYLNRYPGQWEGWNYVHSFLEPERTTAARLLRRPLRPVFNQERYTLCDLESAPVLFDRRCYETYEISPDLRDLLLDLDQVDSVEELVGEDLFGELVEKEIIC